MRPAASVASCALMFSRYLKDKCRLLSGNSECKGSTALLLIPFMSCVPVSAYSTPFHNVLAISPDQGCTADTCSCSGLDFHHKS